jgi:succinate dehydrogenase / fumarate reductase membrane anchor subunit
VNTPHGKGFKNGVKVSERHGAGEWVAERLSSIILIPLTLWGLWAGYRLAGAGYEAARAWAAEPLNAVLLVVALIASIWHMQMGLKVIVDDYIHRASSRGLLLGLNAVVCLLLAAGAVFLVVRLALGSAPLPAGMGV